MVLLLFGGILIAQILGYMVSDKKKINNGRVWTLLFSLFIYFILLPYLFFPTIPEGKELNCGLPIAAIFFVFGFMGGGLTLITHVVYGFIKRTPSL